MQRPAVGHQKRGTIDRSRYPSYFSSAKRNRSKGQYFWRAIRTEFRVLKRHPPGEGERIKFRPLLTTLKNVCERQAGRDKCEVDSGGSFFLVLTWLGKNPTERSGVR
jgi:hypothetical protein